MLRTNTLQSQAAVAARKSGAPGGPSATHPRSRTAAPEAVTIVEKDDEAESHDRPTIRTVRMPDDDDTPTADRITVRVHPVAPLQAPAFAQTLPSMAACRPPPESLALGSLDAVPTLAKAPIQQSPGQAAPETSFVLHLVDGHRTVEDILDSCPLETHEVLRILGLLLADGLISLRPKGRWPR